jgi:hypothetical protein
VYVELYFTSPAVYFRREGNHIVSISKEWERSFRVRGKRRGVSRKSAPPGDESLQVDVTAGSL